ncbi:MAG: VWA domain-containing protein [Candidatus Margulisiibacteriota bacterium]
MMFRFANPYALWLLLILPFLLLWELKWKQHPSVLFSNVSVLKDINVPKWPWKRVLLLVLRILILVLLITALARPQSGVANKEIETYGVDIALVLDISGSMRAEDLKPDRLTAAKTVVGDFIRGRTADRIGLVVFAGKSFTQCPLTLDYDILVNLLGNVKFDMVEDGTAIGMAIANGVNRLRGSKAKSKVMILLTDGENNKGEIDPETAAKLAQSMDIKIYTIGVGKIGGAPIPIYHPQLGKVYARMPDGSLQLSKLNEESLKKIAEITDGKYYRATNNQSLKWIYQQIDKLEKTEIKTRKYVKYSELYQNMVLAALILLLLEITLRWTWLKVLP